jgi:phosphoheptose isomerase/UTP-glucose-1-phosphate uridylyltransferase
MKTIVLCGGEGTRLQPVVGDRPKPMAPIAGRPFLEWLLRGLRGRGIREVTLSTGHLASMIERYFGTGDWLDLKISYSCETQPLGTAGAVRLAVDGAPDDTVLVLNGDSYCPIDVGRLAAEHQRHGARTSLWLVPVADTSRYGWVELSGDGVVQAFREKSERPSPGLISAGVYLLEHEVIDMIPAQRFVSLETEVFPRLVGRGLHGIVGSGPFVDIGTPESYRTAARLLPDVVGPEDDGERLNFVRGRLWASSEVQQATASQAAGSILAAADMIASAFRAGSKVLLCGNGGSAADSQHMAAEFVSVLTKDFQRPGLPAIALTTDTSFLTAFANDLGFEGIFERQLRALGRAGDVLIGISTSGNSPNVRRAVEAAREMGVRSIGLLGEGGPLVDLVDCAVVVPSRHTQHIQESLLPVEHTICHLVEDALFKRARVPA